MDSSLSFLNRLRVPPCPTNRTIPSGMVQNGWLESNPKMIYRMRVVDFYGHQHTKDFVAWARALGFEVEATIVDGGQIGNECGFIAAAVAEKLSPCVDQCSFMTVDCEEFARSRQRIVDGNRILQRRNHRNGRSPACRNGTCGCPLIPDANIGPDLTGGEVMRIVTDRFTDIGISETYAPSELAFNSLLRAVAEAFAESATNGTEAMLSAIANTDFAYQAGSHWIFVMFDIQKPAV